MPKKKNEHHIVSALGKAALCGVIVLGLFITAAFAQKKMETPESDQKKDIKYVFLFIGDGMGLSQVKAAQMLQDKPLAFPGLAVRGMVDTDNVYHEVTDSAAAATAMASGQRTKNGRIGMSKDLSESYPTILEQVKKRGWHTGVITTAPINHATPAGFYAHAEDREDYYSIGLQALNSGVVDYLAGGGFEQPDGQEGNLYELAQEKGFTLLQTPLEVLNSPEKLRLPIIITVPGKDSGVYMEYEIDRMRKEKNGENTVSLPQLVEHGIKTLGMESKFFMVVESAMIDSACHRHDIGSAIEETKALDEAVIKALEFAETHKDETLILITSDHETGGFGMPAGCDLSLVKRQKISWARFRKVIKEIKEAGFGGEEALERVEKYFGMGDGAEIPLNQEEKQRLLDAYRLEGEKGFVDAVLALQQEKAGTAFLTENHTNQPVILYAQGPGQEIFAGWYDNTQIYEKLKKLLEL